MPDLSRPQGKAKSTNLLYLYYSMAERTEWCLAYLSKIGTHRRLRGLINITTFWLIYGDLIIPRYKTTAATTAYYDI